MGVVDEIWAGDLFNRKAEAEQLIGYLETVGMRPSLREDGHAYVLAVDAPYGEGKSFFLRRFAKHMAQNHPVAFVDAWTDDLEDEPLVALAATLETALAGLEDQSGELRRKINNMVEKTGAVAKIAFAGLAKRGLGLLITDHAVQGIDEVIHKVSDDVKDAIAEGVEDLIDEAAEEVTKIATPSMKKRISTFRDGQKAVEAMKASLRELVAYLSEGQTYPPPIVIVIDELDRCRPTYAIKLLEEVKHLFDVQGLVFVLGTHGGALAHSVSAAYGSKFDGSAYLRRFFNKAYHLREAQLYPLVQWIFRQRDLDVTRLAAPEIRLPDKVAMALDPAQIVSLYMELYGFNARDAFAVADAVETCLALSGGARLSMPLLLPLLLARLRNEREFMNPVRPANWTLLQRSAYGQAAGEVEPVHFASEMQKYALMSTNDLMKVGNTANPSFAAALVMDLSLNGQITPDRLDRPGDYPRLLDTVDRFKSAHPNPA